MATVKLRVADSETPREFNLDDVVNSVEWSFFLEEQPGKLTFEIKDVGDDVFFEGSNVVLWVNGKEVFDGYVFTRKRTDADTMNVTAYDRLRYLQNKDSATFDKRSAEEIFEEICVAQKLPYKKATFGNYKTSPITHDNKTLYAMLQRAFDETLIAKGQYLTVRDNLGTLELVDIANLTTNLILGDGSLLTGFDFESSIDSETYNYIKVRDSNKQPYADLDVQNVSKWGRLQYYEELTESLTEAQIKQKVEQLLRLYNRKTKSLSVKCIGVTDIIAGSGVALVIPKLAKEGVAQNQYAYCTKVTHSISNGEYTMELTLEVI